MLSIALLLMILTFCNGKIHPILNDYLNENNFNGEKLLNILKEIPESENENENWEQLDALSIKDAQYIIQYLEDQVFKFLPIIDTHTADYKSELSTIVNKFKNEIDEGKRIIDPVVFIPGFLASALQCHKNGANSPAFCPGNRPDYQCWLSIPKIIRLRCFFSEMSRTYENGGTYGYKMDDFFVDGKDFGGVDGVESINKFLSVPIMEGLIDAFESVGYQIDVSFRAATYDWTFTGNVYGDDDSVQPYYARLKALIEETYRINGNRRVNLMGHSMGTYQGHWFLSSGYVDQTWKNTYIKNMIDITPLYSGAPLSHRALLTGLTPIPLVKWYLRNLVSNWGSVHFFLPFNWSNQSFVITDNDNYFEADTEQLYRDADKPHIADAYPRAHQVTSAMSLHGVPYHCFIGTNITTEIGVDYRGTRAPRFWYETPVSIGGDGDGLVPTYSANRCLSLNPSTYDAYPNINHLGILNHIPFLNIAIDICTA